MSRQIPLRGWRKAGWKKLPGATSLVVLAMVLLPGDALPGSPRPARAGAEARASSPCGNFYDYVNHRWHNRVRVPTDRSSWGAFQEVEQQNEALILASLESALKGELPAEGSTRRKLLDFFASGMNTDAIERAGLSPLDDMFRRIDALENRDDLMAILAHLHRLGVDAGFALEVGVDPDDSSRYIPMVGQAGIGLPGRDFYLKSDPDSQLLRARYARHVAKQFQLAGASSARARRQAEQVVRLETRFARASMTQVEMRDPTAIHNRMTLDGLQQRAPGLDWRRYLVAAGVGTHTDIDVSQPRFLREFAHAASVVAIGDWKHYLRWHVLLAYAPYLPQRFEDEHFRFYGAVLQGMRGQRPRNARVLENIGGYFGELAMGQAIGDLYVERTFTPQARERVRAMVENIRQVLRARLVDLPWMSDDTRAEALHKLDAMRVKIGHRDEPIDDHGLEIDDETYAENAMRVAEFELRRRLDRIGRPVDHSEWGMGAHEVNAYYDLQMNEIVVPAGILRPPFFDMTAGDAENYGAIGSVIGHEITHAFDDEGRHYDHQGNLRDWWRDDDAERYMRLTEPIVRQYAGYAGAGGARLDGQLTLGENIADIGGLKIAYLAFRASQAGQPDRGSDGPTPDQRFFIAYAASWRERMLPQSERMQIATDPHAPTRFRVNGPLVHMPEFAQAFSCRRKTVTRVERGGALGVW